MASIVKKGNDRYMVRVSWYDDFGKRKYSNKTFKTSAEAKHYALTAELNKNTTNLELSKMSFSDYFKDWFELYKQSKITSVTARKYHLIEKELSNAFGNKKISDITRREYQKFLNDYGKNHVTDSVREFNGKIRHCVKNAMYEGIIDKDFTFDVQITGNDDRKYSVEYLSLEEMSALTNEVISLLDYRYSTNYIILTGIMTGMRVGEIVALTWKDINFNFKTININKSWSFKTNEFKPTKNESSNRIIKVNDALLDVLKDLKNARCGKDNDLIFTTNNVIPSTVAINKALRRRLTSLGIIKRGFHFHSLRHSHVAFLIAQGIDLFAISKRLGHKKLSTTTDTYAYLVDEYQAKNDITMATKLDSLVNKNSAPIVHHSI